MFEQDERRRCLLVYGSESVKLSLKEMEVFIAPDLKLKFKRGNNFTYVKTFGFYLSNLF